MYYNMVQPVNGFIAPLCTIILLDEVISMILGLCTSFAHSVMYRSPIPMGNFPHFYHRMLVGWWLQKGYSAHLLVTFRFIRYSHQITTDHSLTCHSFMHPDASFEERAVIFAK